MNRRGKRLTLGVMAVGVAVVLVLAIAHWSVVRDHVEAWHFQLTRETVALKPESDPKWIEVFWIQPGSTSLPTVSLPQILANASSTTVIVGRWWQHVGWNPWEKRDFTTQAVLQTAKTEGWRVIEQRFPRRAYVVIRDPAAEPSALFSGYATVDDTSWLQVITPAGETEEPINLSPPTPPEAPSRP